MSCIVNSLVVLMLLVMGTALTLRPTSNRLAAPASLIIDAQRQRYLSLEKSLWHVVDGGLERDYVLQQVHSGHRTFLEQNFQEKGSYLSVLDHEQRPLFDSLNRINVSVSDTLRSYLRTSTRYYNEPDAITAARLNGNLTHHIEVIYNITGPAEFYRTIRNVSADLPRIAKFVYFYWP